MALRLSQADLEKLGTPVEKGCRLSLGDLDKQPRRVIGAGWDPLQMQGADVDLDLVTLLLSRSDPKDPDTKTDSGLYVASLDRVVHYDKDERTRKVRDNSGMVEYQGDSVDGSESDGDEDEMMVFDYSLRPTDVVGTMTFVNIHKQDNSPDFVKKLTFDQVGRPFVSSFPQGDQSNKRVTSLTQFGGTDTVVIRFDWYDPATNSWTEEFVEQHVQHLDKYQGRPNAGFLSAVDPYGVGV